MVSEGVLLISAPRQLLRRPPARQTGGLESPETLRLRVGRLQVLVENDTRSRRPRVVFHARYAPAGSTMESDRAFVAARGHSLQPRATGRPRVLFERLVEHLADATPTVIGVDAVELHDARHRTELMEKDRVCKRRSRPPPPAIDDLNDVIVVLLTEWPSDHGLSLRCGESLESERSRKNNTHLSA